MINGAIIRQLVSICEEREAYILDLNDEDNLRIIENNPLFRTAGSEAGSGPAVSTAATITSEIMMMRPDNNITIRIHIVDPIFILIGIIISASFYHFIIMDN